MKFKFFKQNLGIYKLISLPALLVSVSMFMIIALNFYQVKSSFQDIAVSQLNRFAVISEKNIENLISVTNSLSSNNVLSTALTDSDYQDENFETISRELSVLKYNYDLIDSFYIYNQKDGDVISDCGYFTADEFFSNQYMYYNYSASYWSNYIFYDSSAYTVLSPSYVQTDSDKKQIIPIVFRKSYNLNFRQKTLLVLNIDINKLFSIESLPKITENTSVLMLNKYTNDLFCPIENSKYIPPLSSDFLHELLIGTSNIFEYKIDKKTVTVATYSVTDSLSGYTYFAVIPHSDIIRSMMPTQLIIGIIATIFMLISICFIVIGSRKISVPILKVISAAQNDDDLHTEQQKDLLDILKSSALRINEEKRIFRLTLPCAQEKFLINFLNSTENYMDNETRNNIISSLPFKYDYFSVVIICMHPSLKFIDTYNSQEYSNIQIGVFDIIKDLFSEYYKSFVIPSKQNELYIILNLKDDMSYSGIDEILDKICSILEFDREYIGLAIGKSKIYKNLSGLKAAHKEALASINSIEFSDIPMANSINLNENEINFNLSAEQEKQFLRILTTESAAAAKPYLDDILKLNTGINARSMRQMYSQILNIILKAMKIREIPPQDPEKLDFEISSDILSLPTDDIYDKILTLLDYMSEVDNPSAVSRLQISKKVVDYIEQNYNNSALSLELLADYFNYSPANISAMIKSSLKLGFHQYLTELRIEKAKELLSGTNLTINQIYKDCGFNSQQTFYRAFKKHTGLTASEYRNQSRLSGK